jgi:UDPglucose--hexose-1-phosphate uridylyltransferase
LPNSVGPFQTFAANGDHELVITRDHDRHFAHFTTEESAEVLRAYRDRFIEIAKTDCGAYISIFHNHGRAAGASVYHNHSQILSTPMIPPEVMRSLDGADHAMMETGRPIHQTMIEWEIQQGRRIVYENDAFIAFCPFVSKAGYQVRIFPKQQKPRFELSSEADLLGCADALNAVLKKLFTALDDVDYNFYIHTAPVQKDPKLDVSAYHWHIDVIPRIPIAAGFELSTTIYINPYDPDDCAKTLRET